LALIVMLALNPVEMARRSRDSRRLSDMETLRKAIDLALADGKSLPDTNKVATAFDTTDSVKTFMVGVVTGDPGIDISKYLSVIPQDPAYDTTGNTRIISAPTGGATVCTDGSVAKSAMTYDFASDGNTYVIRARLESKDNCAIIQNDGKSSDFYEMGTAPALTL
jgi:hypothetical protein